MISRAIAIAFLVTGIWTGPVSAQSTGPSVQIGDRIRVSLHESSSAAQGRLVDVDDTGLTVAEDGSERTFLRSEIAKVEVARGKKSHWGMGALVGAAGGLALTALYCSGDCDEGGEWAGSAAFFAGIGAAGGALVGALIRTERWTSVPVEKLQLAFKPVAGRGLAVSVRLSF